MGLWNQLTKGYETGKTQARVEARAAQMRRDEQLKNEQPSKFGIAVGKAVGSVAPVTERTKQIGKVAGGVIDSIGNYGPSYGSANAKSARKKRPVTPSKKATTGAFLVPIKPKAKPRKRKAAPKKNSFYGF